MSDFSADFSRFCQISLHFCHLVGPQDLISIYTPNFLSLRDATDNGEEASGTLFPLNFVTLEFSPRRGSKFGGSESKTLKIEGDRNKKVSSLMNHL